MNIKPIFSTTALLLIVFSTLIFTACEENNIIDNELTQVVEFVDDEPIQQKVLTISNSTAKKPANAIVTIQTENAEIMQKIQATDFSISPVFELPETINNQNIQNAQINKASKKATSVPKHVVEIAVSNIDIPVSALGYQITTNAEIFGANVLAIYRDMEGNRRSATVENQTEIELFASNSYFRCDYDYIVPLNNDDLLQNGNSTIPINQTLTFEWTPENVYLNIVDVIFDDEANGDLIVTFSVPGSCMATEGCNPDPTITKCGSTSIEPEIEEPVMTQPQSCNTDSEQCNALSTHKIIPNFTLQNMSKFAATELPKNIRSLTSVYLKHKNELKDLFTNNKEVQLKVHQFLSDHKVAIVNSFSNEKYKLKPKQVKAATELVEFIKTQTNNSDLKQTFKQVQYELKKFEGKNLQHALRQTNLNY